MILEKLTIEGFKAISHPLTVKFPSSAIIGVLGPNETGKSTFLESIEFALFGPPKLAREKSTFEELVTWGEEKAKVTLDFVVEQKRYRIQRKITKSGSQVVKLSYMVDEYSTPNEKSSGTIEGIAEVAKEIETILGLDRNAFATLLTIKQQDLDVAKRAKLAERRLLVNKLLGCETFDMAIDEASKDRELLQSRVRALEKQLQALEPNKKTYDRRLSEKQDLERVLSDGSPELNATQGELEDLKSKLESYRWHEKFDSLNNLLASERQKLANMENERQELPAKQDNIARYESTIEKCKVEFDRLTERFVLFKGAEKSRDAANQRLQELQRERDAEKSELSSGELALLTHEEDTTTSVAKQKERTLAGLISIMAAGGALVVLSLFTNPILFVVGIAALGGSVLLVPRYETILKYQKNTKLRSLAQEIRQAKTELYNTDSEFAKLRTSSELSSSEISEKLDSISKQIEAETGAKSIDELYSRVRSLKEETAKILANDGDKKLEETRNRIRSLEQQISVLDTEKPGRTDYHVKLGDDELKILQERYVVQTTTSKMIGSSIEDSKAVLERVYQDLKILKADHDEYPVIQSRLEHARNEIQLLDRLVKELAQTSEEVRNKNFTTFSILMNRILPLVMSQKYSNFEVDNDYKFRVFSQASGKYEEVDAFSSGVQDQFWLVLRLAFAQNMLNSRTSKDKSCVLLDDVISSSDAQRKRAIFQILRGMQLPFGQIFVASHEEIGNYLDFAVVLTKNEDGLVKLEKHE